MLAAKAACKNHDCEVTWFFGQRGSVGFLDSLVDWVQKHSQYCYVDSRLRWLGLAHLGVQRIAFAVLRNLEIFPVNCCGRNS